MSTTEAEATTTDEHEPDVFADPDLADVLDDGEPWEGLPEFEGIIPVGVVTGLRGTSQRIQRPLHLGDKVLLLVEAEVTDIGHGRTKDGVKRRQVLSVSDFYEVAGDEGTELLGRLRKSYREAEDARMGRASLPLDEGDAGPEGLLVDGVVVPPGAAAELAGSNLEDLSATAELERGRGRCAELYGDGKICLRDAGHQGRHRSESQPS